LPNQSAIAKPNDLVLPNVWLRSEKTGIVGSVAAMGVAVGDIVPVGADVLVGWDVGMAVGDIVPVGADVLFGWDVGVAVRDIVLVGAGVLAGWDVAVGVGSVSPQPTSRIRRTITVAIWRAVRPWTIGLIERLDMIFSFSPCCL
jgi:hypothetical protein